MSLLTYIGLALLSWYPLIVGVMIVGGLTAFLAALFVPSREAERVAAPARKRAVVDLREAPAAPAAPAAAAAADTVPAQRRADRARQAA